MPPNREARHALYLIQKLDADNLRWLREQLVELWDPPDDQEGGAPVREPRNPIPPHDQDSISLALPKGEIP